MNWNVEFVWKPRHLWIGASWVRTGNCIDVYINFVPCLSLNVSWWWSAEPSWGDPI